jgi:hypothetical protein
VIHYENDNVTLYHGDCLDVLRELPDESIDAVVTDPPYALEFMGRGWDKFTPLEFELWVSQWAAECLRVLKPGGHMLAFGGSRTWHRLAAGIEDAGFDIRDSIAWLYGSGFPKSLDVSKAIDKSKTGGDASVIVQGCCWIADRIADLGLSRKSLDDAAGTSDMGGWWASRLPHRAALPTAEQWAMIEPILGPAPEWLVPFILPANTPGEAWQAAEVTGVRMGAQAESTGRFGAWGNDDGSGRSQFEMKAANSEGARNWEGWGTALKPAFEPVVVARKPVHSISTQAGSGTRAMLTWIRRACRSLGNTSRPTLVMRSARARVATATCSIRRRVVGLRMWCSTSRRQQNSTDSQGRARRPRMVAARGRVSRRRSARTATMWSGCAATRTAAVRRGSSRRSGMRRKPPPVNAPKPAKYPIRP